MRRTEGMLEITGLTAGYGETRIVEGLSFTVPAGGRLALLGRNGMGKTTTLATLVGQTTRHAGSIRLDGVELIGLNSSARAAAGLGYVPQTRDIFRSLTVEENLVTGLKGRPRSALEEAYALFPRLKERRGNGGGALSGGEQQMLSVARALLGRPTVLLLDEPLEGLAPVICDQLMHALAQLTITLILVEQQVDRALDFAQSAVILERGRVVHEGAAADLRDDHALMERHLGVALAV
ncbi:ABC transporter ATP-binding protein [Azospirillum brasilense]|uniref:ABC transporter ATP-binding protein n=1 Tax=Azospirillum brasilense TaxID=192 RepID=UPI000E6A71E4|nr:ABC transporter ATP-binding protein [Azospirillum brasilense]NUB24061.1 ATP-binding cassette domain-containing protein [Azospirillum brasilense]NUB31182.1 ATP-binding cassette domain-containing protein [Azospirillum brasilense]RIW04108.1 ABC transporter ATP-binding protein [Azospirillum brasilense]